jgi:hypothetical protein
MSSAIGCSLRAAETINRDRNRDRCSLAIAARQPRSEGPLGLQTDDVDRSFEMSRQVASGAVAGLI